MSIPPKILLTRANDQFIELDGLQDPTVTVNQYFNGATVTATLYDQYGNPVAGMTNIAMAYLAGTNGNYRGLAEQTFGPPLGAGYTLKITASQSGGGGGDNSIDAVWEIPVVVVPRTV